MKPRSWLHDRVKTKARIGEARAILKGQVTDVLRGNTPTCACCQASPDRGFLGLYRCYQCDLWLCRACTKAHFPDVARL